MSAPPANAQRQAWSVARRLSPWRRIIQPYNIPCLQYRSYRPVADPRPRGNAFERAKRRREQNKQRREQKMPSTIRGWQWLYLVPTIIVLAAIYGVVEYIVQFLALLAWLIVWLVLLPFAAVEILFQVLVGGVLVLLRALGICRSRVDVYRSTADGTLTWLAVLMVPGFGAAGTLAERLRAHLHGADERAPQFHPTPMPLLQQFNASVVPVQ